MGITIHWNTKFKGSKTALMGKLEELAGIRGEL